MKKLLTLAALIGATSLSFAQGTANFANSGTTLISVGAGGPHLQGSMPAVATGQFYFAVFLAPSGTVTAGGTAADLTSSAFQTVGAVATNSATAGRIQSRNGIDIGSATGNGSAATVDFVIRSWSANAGSTWAQALANWNNGNPLAAVGPGMYIGSSVVANDFILGGGAQPVAGLFGASANQLSTGFSLTYYPVPEPSSMALAGLGAASLLIFRRRK